MRTLIAAIAFCSIAGGQNLTVRAGGKTWPFAVVPTVTSLTCDKTALTATDNVSTCTITLDRPSPGGLSISPYAADSPLILNPPSLVVPAGATSAQFTVTLPATATPPR